MFTAWRFQVSARKLYLSAPQKIANGWEGKERLVEKNPWPNWRITSDAGDWMWECTNHARSVCLQTCLCSCAVCTHGALMISKPLQDKTGELAWQRSYSLKAAPGWIWRRPKERSFSTTCLNNCHGMCVWPKFFGAAVKYLEDKVRRLVLITFVCPLMCVSSVLPSNSHMTRSRQ